MPKPFIKKTHRITAPFDMSQRLTTVEMLVLQGLMRGLSDEEMAGTFGRKPREIDKAWRGLCARFDILPGKPSERTMLICRAFEFGVLTTVPEAEGGPA